MSLSSVTCRLAIALASRNQANLANYLPKYRYAQVCGRPDSCSEVPFGYCRARIRSFIDIYISVCGMKTA